MFSSMKNPNHLVDFHSKLIKYFAKKNNLVLISKDGQRFEASKEIIFAFSAKIEKYCTEAEYHMECDKTVLALMLQFIYFGKSGDVTPSALTTEFDKWMKYYEIETKPIVWDHFKVIEILPSTSNGFKLNSRNLEPMDPAPVPAQVTLLSPRPILTSNKPPAVITNVKRPATNGENANGLQPQGMRQMPGSNLPSIDFFKQLIRSSNNNSVFSKINSLPTKNNPVALAATVVDSSESTEYRVRTKKKKN